MAICPRCGKDYNGILCEKCGYTPYPEDEPQAFDQDEPLSERQTYQPANSNRSRHVWSFLIPLVGIILGAILLSKPDQESREEGTACLLWAFVSWLITGLIIGVVIALNL